MSSSVVAFPAVAAKVSRPAGRMRLAALYARIRSALGRAARLHRERSYLAEMDERMLRDIGITRADLEEELRSPASWSALLFRG